MSKSKENVLNAIAKNIIKIYFAAWFTPNIHYPKTFTYN
jgi:hypothetical protein